MKTIPKNFGNGFSREEMKKAVAKEEISKERTVELNELATQVAEQFSAKSISPFLISGSLRLMDFLVLSVVAVITMAYYLEAPMQMDGWLIASSFLGAIVTTGFVQGLDGYLTTTLRQFSISFFKALTAFTMAFVVTVMAMFLVQIFKSEMLYWLGMWFGYGVVHIGISRAIMGAIVTKLNNDGRLERRAVIIGGGQPAGELIHAMEANPNTDIRICGIFDDRTDDRSPEIVAGYPKLGNIAELVEFTRKARINMLIVSIPLSAEKRVLQLLKRLWMLPVDIRLSAHTNKLFFRQRTYSYEGTVPMVDVFEKPIADWDSVMKRTFDIVVASMAIVALSPIMLITALAVKLDSKGPIIFKQKREGFNNEEIEIFKFRSLYTDQGDKSGVNVVTKGDSRVTKVGRIIRKTSIDELPQLFNVLLGSLSLVGPRPHVANAKTDNMLWTEVVDSYIARHKVKPGVTGWAQINGWRGEVDQEEKLKGRVEYDLYYIENWSLLFDLYILAITPFKLMNTENAY
jgi:Undecaprenyl-phosphate glucose phosphotransferase